MGQKRTRLIAMTACATFSALVTVQAVAQPALGIGSGNGGLSALGGSLSDGLMAMESRGASARLSAPGQPSGAQSGGGESDSPELPGLSGANEEGAEPEPYRFDGGLTVRQETRGGEFDPESGSLAEARNPSFFERHTIAEDHSSVRTCLAAGEVCRAEFDVILATSEESDYDTAVLVNDEVILPPPQDE